MPKVFTAEDADLISFFGRLSDKTLTVTVRLVDANGQHIRDVDFIGYMVDPGRPLAEHEFILPPTPRGYLTGLVNYFQTVLDRYMGQTPAQRRSRQQNRGVEPPPAPEGPGRDH